MNYNHILAYLGYFIIIINTTFFFIGFSKNGKAYKFFSFYLLIESIILITTTTFWSLKLPNIFLSHFYFMIQFILLSMFYESLMKNKTQRKIVNIILIGVVITILFQYLYKPDLFYKFNLFEIVLTSVPLIMYSILHFYNMLGKKREYFYINSGVFLYLSGSTLLFVAGNYIVSSNSVLNKSIWIINSVLFIVYQILIFIEWRKSFYQKKIQ